jgi:AhpD family alkylhydroperoxidase
MMKIIPPLRRRVNPGRLKQWHVKTSLCRAEILCYHLPMNATTENPLIAERHSLERPAQERTTPEKKEPTYTFTEKQVTEKSEIARRFVETRARLNVNVEKANNFLVKRFYNIDHNTYLEGALPARTKELMGLVASACLRCDDCIIYHAIQAYRLGVPRAEQEESLNVALVVGGSIVIPHLRRAYELLEELYA